MKKQLLSNIKKNLIEISLRMAVLGALILFATQGSFAQNTYTWNGASSSDLFTAANWTYTSGAGVTTPSFTATNNTYSMVVTGLNNNTITTTAGATAHSFQAMTLNSGVTFTTNSNLTSNASTTSSLNGTLNVNAGTFVLNKVYFGNVASTAGVLNIASGTTVTGNNVWRVGAHATSGTGTININGGTLTLTGTYGSATNGGIITVGHSNTGVININSGVLNVNYTTFSTSFVITSNGTINIDAGSIVIPSDQAAAMQAFIDAGKIKVSGAALAAAKVLSSTYDSGTGKTTVVAIPGSGLGFHDAALDASSLVVYSQNQNIIIKSENVKISDVKVYDLQGRLVTGAKNIESNESSIVLNGSKAAYVVKVTTADGQVVTRKTVQ